MAYIDAFLAFSTEQALTATAASEDIVDLGAERDMGIGPVPLKVVVMVGTAFTSGGSSTLDIALQTAPNSSGSPGTYITIAQSQQIVKADMTAGAKIAEIMIPPTVPSTAANLGRFLRLNYTVGTANFTAGTLNAYVVGPEFTENVGYPAGVNVAN